MDNFIFELPLKKDNFTALRLTTAAICSLSGLDVDSTEDFKVCITEACLLLLRNGFDRANINYTINNGILANICGLGTPIESSNKENDAFSVALLKELVSDAKFNYQGESLKSIKLEKKI